MTATIIIGAGVIGATTACFLAREGLSVTVLDSQPAPGMETSFANGGLLAANSALPWSSPGTPLQLLKWLGREDAPMLLRPSAIPSLGSWGLKFLANCRDSKYRDTANTLTRFGQRSLRLMDTLLARDAMQFDLGRGGFLEIFKGPGARSSAEAFATLLERMGATVRRLDRLACVALEPSLMPIESSIEIGLWLENDCWGDAHKFTREIARVATAEGVHFQHDTQVTGLEVKAGKIIGVRLAGGRLDAERVIVCGGAASPMLLAPWGVKLPLAPVKGYSLTLNRDEAGVAPTRPIVDDHEHICVTPLGDRLRVAGTVEFAGNDRTLRESRVNNLKQALSNLYPQIRMPVEVNAWCGLRPMTVDGLPYIDAAPVENLFINTGHGALGWTLACASAERIARLVTGRYAPNVGAFKLQRRVM
ncbi:MULTISPECIES: FAD-dependent oxidoreductase [unclassified Pseudomonas]|uniref:FAD-dependent oxidoreductase n=1 Tax=unclassified Pseudomonas TaxID=196821 RepID=UPI0025CC815C|nr:MULTISPECIES: FAD-dependent oxidoreductase [unclassified Pseudomonas]